MLNIALPPLCALGASLALLGTAAAQCPAACGLVPLSRGGLNGSLVLVCHGVL